jgi:hypothetical protein
VVGAFHAGVSIDRVGAAFIVASIVGMVFGRRLAAKIPARALQVGFAGGCLGGGGVHVGAGVTTPVRASVARGFIPAGLRSRPIHFSSLASASQPSGDKSPRHKGSCAAYSSRHCIENPSATDCPCSSKRKPGRPGR